MAYDKPIPITLRIHNPWQGKGGQAWTNYTFLYDWFGGTFRYRHTEMEPPYGDIVQVMCSPFAMTNWALQYSDRVEVLEPQSVREAVVEKIRNLNQKYRVDESLDVRACLKSSNKDSNERKSKNLSRNKEFALTVFPKPAEFVKPAK